MIDIYTMYHDSKQASKLAQRGEMLVTTQTLKTKALIGVYPRQVVIVDYLLDKRINMDLNLMTV